MQCEGFMEESASFTNRLAQEKSPYLLQHAHNPVDWYPWGEEAFEAARSLDRPIFLSIGYATCHWCHVMERESFQDPELAKLLNSVFICIKVDREELPEVDSLYMEFAQSMMSGASGWPLNVILTPTLKPFFAATYLPPHSSSGVVGLFDLARQIGQVWTSEDKTQLEIQASKILEIFSNNVNFTEGEITQKEDLDECLEFIFKNSDPVYGGLKGSPKFPLGYMINLLLHYSLVMNESRALFLAERTLDMMHQGGIYDHLGGGFSRYSVDEKWFVPHFEKMLYDNALLAEAYCEGWKATKRDHYRQIAEEILQYVLREMTSPEGGFYSAQDADSEGREGYYYTWPYAEIQKLLGSKESRLFCIYYGITVEGNFEGRNILHTPRSLKMLASLRSADPLDFQSVLANQREILLKERHKRIPPFKDDKILSSWNGLMIAAMAKAAPFDSRYGEAAVKAARFVKAHLWQEGALMRRWRDEEARFPAALEEYAFMIKGLIALFEADLGSVWLEWALQLSSIVDRDFKSHWEAYYQTDGKDKNILLRKFQFSDGAEPSGNAVHCENLLKLHQLTGMDHYLRSAEGILKAVKEYMDNYPSGYCYHLLNSTRYFDRHRGSIVIAMNSKNDHQEHLKLLLSKAFLPHMVIIWRYTHDTLLAKLLPDVAVQGPINDQTTVYICDANGCKKPLTTLVEIDDAILG
jgi:uncharacterized protein YyaL (SSP411 family)